MVQNVCGTERLIRFLLGFVIIVVAIGISSWVLGIIGVILLLTAVFSYCPINQALSRSTCPISNRNSKVPPNSRMGPNTGPTHIGPM